MLSTVTVTSQGQISIPAEIRKSLDLKKNRTLLLKFDEKKGEINLQPYGDFRDLKGVLNPNALKGKSLDEIIKLENEAIAEAAAKNYLKKAQKNKWL